MVALLLSLEAILNGEEKTTETKVKRINFKVSLPNEESFIKE